MKPQNSACGEIGRRARLRIWCLAMCRFESCQAHHNKKRPNGSSRPFGLFYSNARLSPPQIHRKSAENQRIAANPPKNPPFVLNHRDKEEKRFMDLKSRSQMTENAEFPCSSCHAQPPKNSKCLGIHSLT